MSCLRAFAMLANTTLSLVTGSTEILTEESAAENMRRNSSSVTSLSARTSVCASTPSSFSAACEVTLLS